MFIPADCQELRHRQKHRGGLYKPCSKGPPGLPWPLPPELDDTALEILLFPSSATVPLALEKYHYPSLEELHRELARPNMTLKLLWDKYKQAHPTDTSIASFVSSTTSGRPNSMYRCASVTGPGRRCLSIMPEKPCRSSILALVRSWKPVSLLPRWGPAAYTYAEAAFPQDLPFLDRRPCAGLQILCGCVGDFGSR
jgi:hypothetical protein